MQTALGSILPQQQGKATGSPALAVQEASAGRGGGPAAALEDAAQLPLAGGCRPWCPHRNPGGSSCPVILHPPPLLPDEHPSTLLHPTGSARLQLFHYQPRLCGPPSYCALSLSSSASLQDIYTGHPRVPPMSSAISCWPGLCPPTRNIHAPLSCYPNADRLPPFRVPILCFLQEALAGHQLSLSSLFSQLLQVWVSAQVYVQRVTE
ncbi:uncharacterized protein LOC123643510 [Lemur catta]|uniref:uncharacterized protein LOC123643510 n=1 Tax=Lemur catta TaxID=9447 RepID=UPI001E26E68D|nr:uncharacterized protein LOC123643510 [Lemur catta]XP_045415028.1 uncharacterized protein LOC123643510 [Lemur catta]